MGSLDTNDDSVGTGLVGAPECGDDETANKGWRWNWCHLWCQVQDLLCGSATLPALATEWVRGKSITDALELDNTQIVEELSLPPVKIHCSVLAEDAIKAAIGDYKKKNNID